MHAHADARSPFALVLTWLGALVFLVSLLYFLFSYVTTFGVPAAGGDVASAVTWNVTLFTLFALHHSLFARDRVRKVIERTLPEPLERSFYVWGASLLFIAVCALWEPIAGVAWSVEGPWVWSLRLLQAAGVWITLHSAAILGVRNLAGLRAVDKAIEFKTWGPYGWVRHPIYSGWFLLVFAASPMTMTRLVFAVVSGAYLLVAIPFEERSIRSAAFEAYERYTKQVPWRLLPGVYQLFVVVLLRQPLELLEKHQAAMRRNLEALAACLARHIVVNADEVVLRFFEQRAIAGVGTWRDPRLLSPPDPANRIIVCAPAARALELRGTLLRLLRKELPFIHIRSVHDPEPASGDRCGSYRYV